MKRNIHATTLYRHSFARRDTTSVKDQQPCRSMDQRPQSLRYAVSENSPDFARTLSNGNRRHHLPGLIFGEPLMADVEAIGLKQMLVVVGKRQFFAKWNRIMIVF